MKQKNFSKRHRNLLLAGVGCGVLVLIFRLLAWQGIGIPCLFHQVTGLLCPGCGNSRAALALLRLDVAAALQYNLLCLLEFFYLGWVIFHCCRSYLRRGSFSYASPCIWLDAAVLTVVLLWWILRNIL